MTGAPAWPSEEWVVASAAMIAFDAPLDGTVQVTVPGTPGGEFRYYRTYEAGTVTGGGVGLRKDATATLTLPVAEAAEVLAGRLDPSVAFMRGRLKTAGDNGFLLRLLAAWSSPAGRANLTRLGELAGDAG